jgi:hypothetical protein
VVHAQQLRLRLILVTAVRKVGVRWPPAWELVVRQLLASKDVYTEAEVATALGTFTRRQLVKHSEHLVHAVVNCRVDELATAL